MGALLKSLGLKPLRAVPRPTASPQAGRFTQQFKLVLTKIAELEAAKIPNAAQLKVAATSAAKLATDAKGLDAATRQLADIETKIAEAKRVFAPRLVASGETTPVSGTKVGETGTGSAPAPTQTAAPPASGGTSPAGGAGTDAVIDEFANDDSKTIPAKHLKYLNALHDKLVAAPKATVILVGHTDTVGKEQYNQGLGLRRAERVRDFLTKDGAVRADRISTQSQGETRPAAGQPPAKQDPDKGVGNPKNRRVEIRVKDLQPAPSEEAKPDTPAGGGKTKPADDPGAPGDAKKDAKKEVALSNQESVEAPHLGVDVQVGRSIGSAPWSLQAGLVYRDYNKWKDKARKIDYLHEPNISLTFDSKGGIAAQEAISVINKHWMPAWNREIETSIQLLLNENLSPKLGISGGVQGQGEFHVTPDTLSLALSLTGTVDQTGTFALTGQASIVLHLDFIKK